jgi:hypothetical protein
MKKLQDNLAARIAASVILTVSFLLTLLSTAGIVLLAPIRPITTAARSCVHPICMRQGSGNTTTMSNRCWKDLSMSRRAIRIT